MSETTWQRVCVLCARRNVDTRLEHGHCCPACQAGIAGDLAQLLTLATDASTDLTPAQGMSGARGFESKPPIRLDNAAPHLALIELTKGDPSSRVTITDSLTSWEIVIRSERLFARYGIATEADMGDVTRGWTTSELKLSARAFTQAVGFLRANLDWICASPTFPLEQFVDEVQRARGTMRGMLKGGGQDRVVKCPTLTDDGTCGASITIRTWAALDARDDDGRPDHSTGETTVCRRCGAVRSAAQLLHTAGTEDTYADAEALALHFGISQTVIRKWARAGKVAKDGSRYRWADVKREADTLRTETA